MASLATITANDREQESATDELADRFVDMLTQAVRASSKNDCEIAKQAGLTKQQLHKILNCTRKPSLTDIIRVLKACDVPPMLAIIMTLAGNEDVETGPRGWFLERYFLLLPKLMDEHMPTHSDRVQPRWADFVANQTASQIATHVRRIVDSEDMAELSGRRA